MIAETLKNKIIAKMNEKEIKAKYQKYLYKYIELNIELFNFLDIEGLIERLLENFNGIYINLGSLIMFSYGEYNPTTGKIYISPKLFFRKSKKYKEGVILHELDHCACSPIRVKKEYKEYKKNHYILPDFILRYFFLKTYYSGPTSGILNSTNKDNQIRKIIYGTNWENYLNEGITSLKQVMYCDKLNIKFHYNQDFYEGIRKGAKCLANVIGMQNMINLHFNNNLSIIEKDFYEKTGISLENLVLKCMEYDKSKRKRKKKELEKLIIEIENKK